MSGVASAAGLNVIEKSICDLIGVDKSLVPYSSGLDLLSMRVVDLSDAFRYEKDQFKHLTSTISHLFFQIQLQIEMTGAFCPRHMLDEASISTSLFVLKDTRRSLRELIDNKLIKCLEPCDKLSKLFFLTELRAKKIPFDHLLLPLELDGIDYDRINEVSLGRFMTYLHHYYYEISKILGVNCDLISTFLTKSVLFDPDPIMTRTEILENTFRDFLWELLLEKKSLSSSIILKSAKETAKILDTCRFIHLFFTKVMGVGAAIERARRKELEVSVSDHRTSLNLDMTVKAHFCLKLFKALHEHIFKNLERFKLSPFYPSLTEELSGTFIDNSMWLISPTAHHDEMFLDYLDEIISRWAKDGAKTVELYFEGYFFDKELALHPHTMHSEIVSKAFCRIYELCVTCASADHNALELKESLEEILPHLQVFMAIQKVLPFVLQSMVQDILYPKTEAPIIHYIEVIKQQWEKFPKLSGSARLNKHEALPIQEWLLDPEIKKDFEHVYASLNP